MTSTRPYLLRALYEWMVDNDLTPHLLVDASLEHVEVPMQYIEDDKITLNITPSAVRDLEIGNDYLSFSARFSGKAENILAPIRSVLAIYAKENGEGMVFSDDNEFTEAEDAPGTTSAEKPTGKPSLKIGK